MHPTMSHHKSRAERSLSLSRALSFSLSLSLSHSLSLSLARSLAHFNHSPNSKVEE